MAVGFLALTLGISSGRAAHAQTLPGSYVTTWVGNSFPGTPTVSSWNIQEHVQTDIEAMYVAPNGTCYTDSIWDEGASEAGFYQNGAIAGICGDNHGWGRYGGQAVTSDGTYVYVAVLQTAGTGYTGGTNSNGLPSYPPNTSTNWYCVRRYNLDGTVAPFSNGYGYDGSLLVVTTNGTDTGGNDVITGLACANGQLYVSDITDGVIKVYSLSSLSQTPGATWTEAGIGQLAVDGYGNLWGLYYSGSAYTKMGASLDQQGYAGTNTCELIQIYTPGGHVGSGPITFASGAHPAALGYNFSTGLMMVADQGPDQNIKCYNPTSYSGSPTTVVSTIGATGGVYSGTKGQAGALRFAMPSGVGADSSGKVYVSQDGGLQLGASVLESYTGSTRNWVLYGMEWLDNADIDSGSQSDVYTNDRHFSMNWNNTTPGTEWSYTGYTINPFDYPQDPRLHISGITSQALEEDAARIVYIGGQKFLVVFDAWGRTLGFYRFNSTEGYCGIPSTLFSVENIPQDKSGWPANEPSTGEWIWRDANGNGSFDSGEYNQPSSPSNLINTWSWWIDSNGDVWEVQETGWIRHFKYQGLDSEGNPIYNYSNLTSTALPSPFSAVERIEYFPSTDTMYLTGYTPSYPNTHGDWRNPGKVIYRYDNWSTSPTVHSGYPIVLPFNDSSSPQVWPASIDVNGSYIFVTYSAQNWIYVYSASSGAELGLMSPTSSVGGNASVTAGTSRCMGYTDIVMGIRAFERSNGEYDICQEDDGYGKVAIYRWTNNLLPDPGFELNPINANGWDTSYWSGSPTFTWSTTSHSGSRSAEISGSGINAAYFTPSYIPVTAGASYTFGGWVKTSSLTGTGAFIVLSQFDSSGTWLGNLSTSTLTGTNNWTDLTSTVTLAPTCTQVTSYCYSYGSGTAYFDDVTLTPN